MKVKPLHSCVLRAERRTGLAWCAWCHLPDVPACALVRGTAAVPLSACHSSSAVLNRPLTGLFCSHRALPNTSRPAAEPSLLRFEELAVLCKMCSCPRRLMLHVLTCLLPLVCLCGPASSCQLFCCLARQARIGVDAKCVQVGEDEKKEDVKLSPEMVKVRAPIADAVVSLLRI
jgi:hypothetical protein